MNINSREFRAAGLHFMRTPLASAFTAVAGYCAHFTATRDVITVIVIGLGHFAQDIVCRARHIIVSDL